MWLEDLIAMVYESYVIRVVDENGNDWYYGYKDSLNDGIDIPRKRVAHIYGDYEAEESEPVIVFELAGEREEGADE